MLSFSNLQIVVIFDISDYHIYGLLSCFKWWYIILFLMGVNPSISCDSPFQLMSFPGFELVSHSYGGLACLPLDHHHSGLNGGTLDFQI